MKQQNCSLVMSRSSVRFGSTAPQKSRSCLMTRPAFLFSVIAIVSGLYNLNQVAIRVGEKIKPCALSWQTFQRFWLQPHLFMLFMRSLKIDNRHSQVRVPVAKFIRLFLVMIAGQFQLKVTPGGAQITEGELVFRVVLAPRNSKAKSLLVEAFRLFKVHNTNTGMDHFV